MAIVKNKQTDSINLATDVYIMRPSRFGNPFVLGIDGDRTEVIAKYKEWLTTGESFGNKEATEEARQKLLKALPILRNKNLICKCKPYACHGDVLLELINKEKQ